jgi:hypothetical protein
MRTIGCGSRVGSASSDWVSANPDLVISLGPNLYAGSNGAQTYSVIPGNGVTLNLMQSTGDANVSIYPATSVVGVPIAYLKDNTGQLWWQVDTNEWVENDPATLDFSLTGSNFDALNNDMVSTVTTANQQKQAIVQAKTDAQVSIASGDWIPNVPNWITVSVGGVALIASILLVNNLASKK